MFKQLREARTTAAIKIELFMGLCHLNGLERVTAWELMPTTPCKINGEWHSVYRNMKSQGELNI
jgi:hypothetical protein